MSQLKTHYSAIELEKANLASLPYRANLIRKIAYKNQWEFTLHQTGKGAPTKVYLFMGLPVVVRDELVKLAGLRIPATRALALERKAEMSLSRKILQLLDGVPAAEASAALAEAQGLLARCVVVQFSALGGKL